MPKGRKAAETREQMLARMAEMRAKRQRKQALVGAIPINAPKGLEEANVAPPNLFSGDQKHLELIGKNGSIDDPIPGYECYWFVDADGTGVRIQLALRSGYEHITTDEVLVNDTGMGGIDDVGGKVRKLANIHSGRSGEKPIYQWAMKIPLWIHEKHQADMQAVVDRQEAALKKGYLPRQRPEDKQYVPVSAPIEINSKLYR
jgi:hypothetical protein